MTPPQLLARAWYFDWSHAMANVAVFMRCHGTADTVIGYTAIVDASNPPAIAADGAGKEGA